MSVGKFEQFDPAADNWTLYLERLEQYFVVNSVKEENKVSTLITIMGSKSYELLVTLCAPDKPAKKTFEELGELMKNFLQPKPSIMAERHKFRQRTQRKEETVSEYMAVLKKLAKDCDFGSELDSNLRDQLVCGLRNESIRQSIFCFDKVPTFSKAYHTAISMEAAEEDSAAVECRTNWERNGNSEGSAVLHVNTARDYGRGRGRTRAWGAASTGGGGRRLAARAASRTHRQRDGRACARRVAVLMIRLRVNIRCTHVGCATEKAT